MSSARGADPTIETELGVSALQVAAGIGWVEGITFEWSPQATFEAVKWLLKLHGGNSLSAEQLRPTAGPRSWIIQVGRPPPGTVRGGQGAGAGLRALANA